MEDRAILRQGLDILDGMVRTLEQGDRIDIADAAAVLKLFQTLDEIDEQALVGAAETALKSRKGLDFVQSSRQLTAVLRNHLSAASTEQERGTADAVTERFVNLTRLEYKYASKTAATARRRSASASYGA